jgi:hypothetical protein
MSSEGRRRISKRLEKDSSRPGETETTEAVYPLGETETTEAVCHGEEEGQRR